MRIHVLGICGTLMGSLALLARQAGHQVTGSDQGVYPPMSTLLADEGIEVREGFDPAHLRPHPDLVLLGNAGLARGNPVVEYLLDQRLPFLSGAEWLGRHMLKDRWVIAVAGTHGKTTTASMVAWILQRTGTRPGYLIGGVPLGFPRSADLGDSPCFVVEADEYDTSFFDRRSKFLHYGPRTLVLNNLEYDHADIFPDLAAIQEQFHLLVRSVPGTGLIIRPQEDQALDTVLRRGCWTPLTHFDNAGTGGDWSSQSLSADDSHFKVLHQRRVVGEVAWGLAGRHNRSNALAALAAAHHAGVEPAAAVAALGEFKGVKRRLELIHESPQVCVYDDFAHHPTAIAATIGGLRRRVGTERIVAIIDPASHTMRGRTHLDTLAGACAEADLVLWHRTARWHPDELAGIQGIRYRVHETIPALLEDLIQQTRQPGGRQHLLIMSNGKFGGLHRQLIARLESAGRQ